MADLLKTGSDWVDTMRRAWAVQSVVYRRGSYSLTLDATPAATRATVTDATGLAVRVSTRDFIFGTDELVDANGDTMEPRAGDRIEVTLQGVTEEYEVARLGDEPEWRWGGPYHQTRRVHTVWNGEAL